ncbi:probable threonine protease PRSS50 [Nomascus leucogenys]|uniref:probable threonine protease PRSS50 n=1 Tax=Nomascus leucogenys TaxID=61853 RepID=UPI00122D95DD|nr:probable threonine protease PRSS50 [Nomascus leucogenys]
MGPWCQSLARGQRPRTSAPSRAGALLLLLLLLLRPAGCWGAGEAPGALSTADPADQSVQCVPKATCPSSRPRLLRQAPTTQTPPLTTMETQSPVSEGKVDPYHFCGFSYEQDPTLRDPEAVARRWPWMVSVRANGTHICAGTIIASQWVLTVAHCLIRRDVIYSVRVGSPWIDRMTQTASDVPVLQVIMHSRYRAQRFWSWVGQANDIGLLKLEQELKYSKYVWPICLPGTDYVLKDHSLCTVTGWGLPKADGMWPQFQTIQEKEVIILNSKECDNFYHNFTKIPTLVRIIKSQMMCAEDTHREQFCYELTGEPLVCSMEGTWYLVGLVSWGAGCQKSEAPPIYLQVSSYQHWIWDCLNGQALALPAPSRALLLALPLPLSLLAAL